MENHPKKTHLSSWLVGDTNISAFRSWLVKACSQNVKVTGIRIMASKIRVHDMAGHDIKNNKKNCLCSHHPWGALSRHGACNDIRIKLLDLWQVK